MPENPITFSVDDYPQLGILITGQETVLVIKARVGLKIMTSGGERISLLTDSIEVVPERRPSPQEVLMDHHQMNYQAPRP